MLLCAISILNLMIIPIAIDIKRNNDEKKLEKINLFLEITNFIYLFDFFMLLIIKGIKRFKKEECLAV